MRCIASPYRDPFGGQFCGPDPSQRQGRHRRCKDGRGGPTGVGDEWVRVGPIKLFLDGGMLNGTAFMRDFNSSK
jgi:hypothetical protein